MRPSRPTRRRLRLILLTALAASASSDSRAQDEAIPAEDELSDEGSEKEESSEAAPDATTDPAGTATEGEAALPEEPLPRAARLPAPAIRSIAFVDPHQSDSNFTGEGGDCETFWARRGACTERVRFAPVPDAFSTTSPGGPTGEAWRALLKNTSALTSWNLDGIALRWFRSDDPLASTVQASDVLALPQPTDTWLQARAEDKRLFSLPHRNTWLDEARWVDDRDTAFEAPLFPLVEVHPQPDGSRETAATNGLPLPPQVALLKGRFAERLGYNSQPHPFEIMDGDEDSSGPFFEQMFPFNTLRRADRIDRVRPLARFQDPARLNAGVAVQDLDLDPHQLPVFLDDLSPRGFVQTTAANFEEFARLMGVSVMRYALSDHTLNQMRILTAVTAMRSPPDGAVFTRDRYEGLVAAARGETDSDSQLGFDFQRQLGGVAGGIQLRLRMLPGPVRDAWLERLVAETLQSTAETRPRLRSSPAQVLAEAEARLRSDDVIGPLGLKPDSRLQGLGPEAIAQWLNETVVQTSRLRPFVFEDANAIALGAVLNGLQPDARNNYETWILLDHLDFAIADALRAGGGQPQPPSGIAATGQAQFVSVLETHGRSSAQVPQGLQAVDPLAICTQEPGPAALNEPAFKPVRLDLLVTAPDPYENEIDPTTVLWNARDQVPFLAVDDPGASVPQVTKLTDLPGPDSVYRVRWNLWSGWHLLWAPQDLDDGRTRLAVRTAAVCENMVLAQPSLVPTLLRSALLSGELFPTEPFRWRHIEDGKDRRQAKKNLRLDGTVGGKQEVGRQPRFSLSSLLAGTANTAKKAVAVRETGAAGALKDDDPQSKAANLERRNRTSVLAATNLGELEPGQTATYLHGIVHPKLREIAAEKNGLLLMVFDHHVAQDRRPTGDGIRPRTPYRRVHRGVPGPIKELRSAGWTLWVPPGEGAIALVGPSWRETDLVKNVEHPVPRWKPRRPGDWTMTSSFNVFPFRQVRSVCTDDTLNNSTVAPCFAQPFTQAEVLPGGTTARYLSDHYSQGLGIDLGGMYSWWLFHRPRVAFESGLEGRLDVVLPGTAFLYPQEQTRYAPTFAWTGGPMFGLRFAPRPSSLWRRTRQGNTWGPLRAEGGNRVGRSQFGVRGGVLFGAGFSGPEVTLASELWYARSIRNIRSVHQSFTPYHPALFLGPFVRAQYTTHMPFVDPAAGAHVLDHAWTLLLGAKVNLRIKSQGPTLPSSL